MSGLTPLVSGAPDEIDLELRLLGAVDDAATLARIDQAASGSLAEAAAEMEAYRDFWKAHAPPLPAPAPRRRWPAWAGPVVALAAALLLAVGVGLWWPAPEPGVRPMGGLPVDLQATRGTVLLEAPYQLTAGDELHVAFQAPVDGFVDVWTLQQDGATSVLASGEAVEAGAVFSLYGAARLDDYGEREWLVVQLSQDRRDEKTLRGAALLPEPREHASERLWVLEVTRWR